MWTLTAPTWSSGPYESIPGLLLGSGIIGAGCHTWQNFHLFLDLGPWICQDRPLLLAIPGLGGGLINSLYPQELFLERGGGARDGTQNLRQDRQALFYLAPSPLLILVSYPSCLRCGHSYEGIGKSHLVLFRIRFYIN
jgi:hypothetical protein